MLEQLHLLFIGVTLPVYLVLLVILHFKKEFNSSFYTLFKSTAIADILISVHMSITKDIAALCCREQFASSPLPLATITHLGNWFFYYAQFFGAIVMAMNRCTAIVLPFRHETIWSKRMVTLAVFVQWFIPALIAFPIITPCCHARYVNGTLLPLFADPGVALIYPNITNIIRLFFICPLIFVLNAITVVCFKRYTRQMSEVVSNSSGAQNVATEKRLVIVSCALSALVFFTILMSPLWQLSANGIIPISPWTFSTGYDVFYQTFTLGNPYLIIFLSPRIRSKFIRLITCRRSIIIGTISLPENRQRQQVAVPDLSQKIE